MAYHRREAVDEHAAYHNEDYATPSFNPLLDEDGLKYGAEKYNPDSTGYKSKEEEEKKEESSEFEKQLEESDKKKDEKMNNEDIQRIAASEVNLEMPKEDLRKTKKQQKSIEEAIEKAITEEKKVIFLNR
jgi:hypothetical protein